MAGEASSTFILDLESLTRDDEDVQRIVDEGMLAVEELEGPLEGRTARDLVRLTADGILYDDAVISGARQIQADSEKPIPFSEAAQKADADLSFIAGVVRHLRAVVETRSI